jgi:hypothetical protein
MQFSCQTIMGSVSIFLYIDLKFPKKYLFHKSTHIASEDHKI